MSTQTQTLKLVGKPSYAHGSWPKNLGHSTHDPCSERTVTKDLNSQHIVVLGIRKIPSSKEDVSQNITIW